MLCSVWSLHGWRLWYLELKHEPLYEYLGTSFLSGVFHQIGHFSTKPSHAKNWFAFSTSELQQSQLQRRKWEHWDLWAQQILWTWTTYFKWCIFFSVSLPSYNRTTKGRQIWLEWECVNRFPISNTVFSSERPILKHQFNLLTRVTKRSGSLANKSTWNLTSRSHYRTWSSRPK